MGTKRPRAKDAHGNTDDGATDSRLRWYPQSWRSRYGDESIALLDDEYGGHLPVLVRLSLIPRGLQQRARQSGLTGDSATAFDGIRAGALVVLAAWTAFVVAGLSFAKFSEHFDEALPHRMGAHRVPDLAVAVLQTVAGLASVLVVTGAILAVPAFIRFVQSGGWISVRAHFTRALSCTVLTGAATAALVVWAHHLTPHQRNAGGLHGYEVLFLIWTMLVVITLALWTVATVTTASRVVLPRAILTAEAVLAVAVAGSMLVMISATALWWGEMATQAPAFLKASPAGVESSPWDGWLVATVALMALAVGVAAGGVVREVRVWTRMRAG
jgi:hypothetical protein